MRAPAPDALTPPRWRAPLLLAGATVLALVPFANKAFHIDDPLFLWAARQIRSRPLDFYGFSVNWYGIARPMSDVMKNPPLDSYFIAAVAAIAGESEIVLHLAFLPPAIAAVLGTYALARRFCARPAAAALATLGTPVFLVSALAALTKYFGVALLPLLLVHGAVRRRRLGPWALPLLLTLGALAAYQAWTVSLYGRGLLFDAASYAGAARTP